MDGCRTYSCQYAMARGIHEVYFNEIDVKSLSINNVKIFEYLKNKQIEKLLKC